MSVSSAQRSPKPRRVNAACWHGYYAFMRELYKLEPATIIQSTMAHYISAEDLEAHAEASGERNVGSQASPYRYRDACECVDDTIECLVQEAREETTCLAQ